MAVILYNLKFLPVPKATQISAIRLVAINSKNTPTRLTITLVSTYELQLSSFPAPVHAMCAQQLWYLLQLGITELVWPTDTTDSPDVMYTALLGGKVNLATLDVRNANSSLLLFGLYRKSTQLPESLLPDTFLHTPLPLFSLVDSCPIKICSY